MGEAAIYERQARMNGRSSTVCLFMLVACVSLVASSCSANPSERSTTLIDSTAVPVPTEVVPPTPTAEVSTPEPQIAPTATAAPAPATPKPAPPEPGPTVVPFAPGAAALLSGNVLPPGSRIGLIANHASTVDGQSAIDLLAAHPTLELAAIFAPEHGPRGDLDAGVTVPGGLDAATGVTVHSLYGAVRSPTPAMLADLDALVYDLQGVGARHYTYISTMGLAMQAAAEAGLPFVVLDRPNPLGTVAASGHVLDAQFESFIGPYPIPQVHGLTAAELANAIVDEAWLPGLDDLTLILVPMQGWTHGRHWNELDAAWVPPSPGLPTAEAATVYPGTVFFEATTLSYGRGTEHVFRQIGAPWIDAPALAASLNGLDLPGVEFEAVSFTPRLGTLTVTPAYVDTEVQGVRWSITDVAVFEPIVAGAAALQHVLEQGSSAGVTVIDRPDFLDLLAGTDAFRQGLEAGDSAEVLAAAWRDEAAAFDRSMRRYRLYPD